MAYSSVPKTKRDGKIELRDGSTPTPVVLGMHTKMVIFPFLNRSNLAKFGSNGSWNFSTIRKQDEQAITGSFAFHFRQFTDTVDAGSVRDFINQTGSYNANVSTGTSGVPYVEHYCIDIIYTAEGTNFGDDNDHSVTLSKCVCSLDFSEGDPSSFTLNFTCYGGATVA